MSTEQSTKPTFYEQQINVINEAIKAGKDLSDLPYVYIGPDGKNVNDAIFMDRNAGLFRGRTLDGAHIGPVRESTFALNDRAKAPVLGENTAKLVLAAIGVSEARRHEGRE